MSIEDQLRSFELHHIDGGEITPLMIMALMETLAEQLKKQMKMLVDLSHRTYTLERRMADFSLEVSHLTNLTNSLKENL